MRAFEIRNADVVAPKVVDAAALERERAKRYAGGWMDPDTKVAMKAWGGKYRIRFLFNTFR